MLKTRLERCGDFEVLAAERLNQKSKKAGNLRKSG
jgi:hypothetical protein